MTTWQFPPPVRPSMIETWTPGYALVMFFMWWIMMIAMMTPSASPMVLLYGRAYRHEQCQGKLAPGIVPTFVFVFGYLLAWGVFSAIATGLQWGLERAGLIHQMLMWSINPLFSAAILIVAGLYQLLRSRRHVSSIADHQRSSFPRTSDLVSLAQLVSAGNMAFIAWDAVGSLWRSYSPAGS